MHERIAAAKAEGRNLLEYEAWALFAAYGISVPRCRLAKSVEEAVRFAAEIGFPVVLKIVSPDILHKSDAGGVKVNLGDAQSVREGFAAIMNSARAYRPEARLEGVLVCEMLPAGLETIIGMTQDVSFGPAFMFGLGGIFVEVLRDVSFRVLPLTKADALEMIREIKGYSLLRGIRGETPKDEEALADLIVKVAKMVEENPEIRELDINPCFVYSSGARPADARVML
jgi:acetate---CoA ligase (ADP-forming) subunit beta